MKTIFNRYRILFLVCCILGIQTNQMHAQQDPLYAQYMFNTLAINPAYAGNRDVISVTALYRKQWLQIDNSPQTVTLTADMPISDDKMGVGLSFYYDQLGVNNNIGVYGQYAYRIRLPKGTLALGLNAGFTNYTSNLAGVQTSKDITGVDPAFSQNINKALPNFGLGIFYNTDKLYVGLSAPHLVNNSLVQNSNPILIAAGQRRHWFLMGGYVIAIDRDIKLKPSLMLRYVEGAGMNMDINCNLWLLDMVAVGLSYRTSGMLAVMAELQATRQFRIGYCYDATLNKIGPLAGGSHEILMRYEFGFVQPKVVSPRYF